MLPDVLVLANDVVVRNGLRLGAGQLQLSAKVKHVLPVPAELRRLQHVPKLVHTGTSVLGEAELIEEPFGENEVFIGFAHTGCAKRWSPEIK